MDKEFRGRNLPDLHRWQNMYWSSEDDCFPPRTAALAVRWLEENYKQHPFLLWVDFLDLHEPWDPPEYMVRRYDPDYAGCPMIHPNYGKARDLSFDELRNLRAHYCAEAELVDRWVGRILQKIEDLGLWDNSVVMFTTDHGMSLGEHNRTGKSNINERDERYWPIYPEIAHIPLLVAAPGVEGGEVVDALLQPVDILPTLIALAGLEIQSPEPIHGCSFASLLGGESGNGGRDMVISGSYLRSDGGKIPAGAVTPVVYTRQWAYVPVGSEGEIELYQIQRDPCATTNVAQDHGQVAREMHGKLTQWLPEINAPEQTVEVLANSGFAL